MIMIIQDILDLSKIEAGQMDINNDDEFSLPSVITQTQKIASTLLKQKNKEHIDFISTVDDGIGDFLKGDQFRLRQVINNLVSNAVKFTKTGTIKLKVRKQSDDILEFSVIDTGKGIPSSHLESIFEPFRQVEMSDIRQHGGTGLGLTICRHLVKMMGGSLRVESSIGSGSSFIFLFPYCSCHSPLPKREHRTTSQVMQDSSRQLINGKILVAEDDTVSRKLANRMLTRFGYNVVLAKDGEEAVSCFESSDDIALILMDVQMPKMDGLSATRKIRELEDAQSRDPIPILALSAAAMKGDKERGIAAGMTDYLTKPLNFKLVITAIKKYAGCAKLASAPSTPPTTSKIKVHWC